jgi:hypothetical protein
MARHRRRHVPRPGLAFTVVLSALLSTTAYAADQAPPTGATPAVGIFNPTTAPVIKVKVVGHRLTGPVTPKASETVIGSKTIEQHPADTTFTKVIAQSVAGAASAPNGDIHIRGSHGQYSYYLDGAPLPENVSGSFSDLINPKSIQTLRVYTGGFPAQYGGQLAAIFDVTAKAGKTGAPGGSIQQLAQTYGTYQTNAQVGGSEGDLSYYVAGIKDSSDFRLSPPSQDNFHNNGTDNVIFGKFDLQKDSNDLLTLDLGDTGASFQIPNTPQSQQINVNDYQKENGSFANLIFDRTIGHSNFRTAIYSHQSSLRFFGSPADLQVSPGAGQPAVQTNENQNVNYVGIRTDYLIPSPKHHALQLGFDYDNVTGTQNFILDYSNASDGTVTGSQTDIGRITGADRSEYIQDDYTSGRTLIDTGVRYDEHAADITTYQLSPRFNYYYKVSGHDKFHAFYDHLFQPAAFEDVKALIGNGNIGTNGNGLKPFQPETDNFYETGWQHTSGADTEGISLYYRDEKNTIDDSPVGNTQLTVPVNFSKGYTRGIEFTFDGSWSKTVTYYANYARAWAFEAYPVSGGLLNDPTPSGYIPDDHDQTQTASFGADYTRKGTFFTLDGEYGSGFPYNPTSNVFQYIFTHPHLTFDTSYGFKATHSIDATFVVGNIMNNAYIIKQAGEFSDTEWAPGRTYGFRITQNF